MLKVWMKIGLILTVISGCASTQYVTNPLRIPEEPTPPPLFKQEFVCVESDSITNECKSWLISTATLIKIQKRDKLRASHIQTLTEIMRSTHE